jgi:hypothetical protein
VVAGPENYELLVGGNKILLAEHNALREHSEDMEYELTKVSTSTVKGIAAMETRIRFIKAHA